MAASLPDKPALPGADWPLPGPDSSSPTDTRPIADRRPSSAETEETDIWWGSYAGRTMLPGFLLCFLLTAVIWVFDWYLEARQQQSELVVNAALGAVGALWLIHGTRWVYRMIAVNYRLTTRRLLCERGFNLPDRGINLARVAEVLVLRGALERLLGVGRISILLQDNTSRTLILDGVLAPERVARIIRRRVRQARARAG